MTWFADKLGPNPLDPKVAANRAKQQGAPGQKGAAQPQRAASAPQQQRASAPPPKSAPEPEKKKKKGWF